MLDKVPTTLADSTTACCLELSMHMCTHVHRLALARTHDTPPMNLTARDSRLRPRVPCQPPSSGVLHASLHLGHVPPLLPYVSPLSPPIYGGRGQASPLHCYSSLCLQSSLIHRSLHHRPRRANDSAAAMADRDRSGIYGGTHGGNYGQHQGGGRPMGEQVKGMIHDKGPTASQALTVATLFPLGGLLLVLSGLALAASVVGLALATPVFLLFSPVLVPAALLIGTAVTGFLTSGALGLGGLSSLTCLANTARQAFQRTPDYVEEARRRMAEAAAHAGQKTAQAGHAIQSRAQEAGAGTGGGGRASS